jgi:tetratricopeptide (TPR) repeat protein
VRAPLSAVLLVASLACGPRVPPPPPIVSSGGVLAPPSQARAAVARGWLALAGGDGAAAEAAASRARRLDPSSAEPLRLASAVAMAAGEPEEAARLLDEALEREPACARCLGDRALRTGADADASLAIAAGARAAPIIQHGPWPPGPRTRAAWRERVDLDAAERALRGRALQAAGEGSPALHDLRAAGAAGVADLETLSALVAAGDPAMALHVAGRAAARFGGDAQALGLWFALAQAHGTAAEAAAAAKALGALPAPRLGGEAGMSAAAALRVGRPPPELSAPAAWHLLAESPGLGGGAAMALLGDPADAAGLAVWLRAADATGVQTGPIEAAALASGVPEQAEVVVRRRLARGDASGAAAAVQAALLDPLGTPPVWWPLALDAAGHPDAAAAARARFGPGRAQAALLVATAAVGALAAVDAAGPNAAELRPLALAQAGRPCDAVAAFVTLRSQSGDPVPGVGAVGYAGAIAGCWTAEALPVLRDAQAVAPADGRLAHALGRVLLDLGDPTAAARPLAQARRALPEDAALHADLVRLSRALLSRALEDRP